MHSIFVDEVRRSTDSIRSWMFYCPTSQKGVRCSTLSELVREPPPLPSFPTDVRNWRS
jgi:hypothetical protein